MQRGTSWLCAGLLALSMAGMPAVAPAQSRAHDFGGFVELDTRFGDMMGEFAAFAGARLAVRLKNRIYLGVGGEGLATDNARVAVPGARLGR